ncbi:MAG: glycosyltransferase family 4 protein [Acidobacteriota bacterium]|nr:glycosyltransferase family 4 protein [Acidobacteriota bacterium]
MSKWPVLLLVESLGHGGCERDATKIAIGLDRSRFEPHVAVFHPGGFLTSELDASGVPILALPLRSFLNSSMVVAARKMGAYIRRHGIQLVHAFDVPTDIFAAPVARWYGVPAVVTSQLSYRSMYSPWRRAALRLTDWLAQRIVTNSQAVGESLRRSAGFPGNKLYLCYNGVNTADFYPGPGIRVPEFEGVSLIVGSVCVMRPEKRIDWLLEAFAEVSRTRPELRLMLVGSGPEASRLLDLRDRLGLREICHFEPTRPNPADWMRGIDIFVNASSIESFPNAVLEAMACGCCVIGSNVGGIPELITHNQDGLLFESTSWADLAAAIRLAASEAELRERLRQQAVLTSHRRFSMKITLERTEALYESLLDPSGAGRMGQSAASQRETAHGQ